MDSHVVPQMRPVEDLDELPDAAFRELYLALRSTIRVPVELIPQSTVLSAGLSRVIREKEEAAIRKNRNGLLIVRFLFS